MKFVPVRGNPDAAQLLWELLTERPRENRISHEHMPTRDEHEAFVEAHPFRYWYLIDAGLESSYESFYVGAMEATERNEIGISILKCYQRRGYGIQALKLFVNSHDPLPAVAAVRNGRWLANIATHNIGSKLFFAGAGFRAIQETWSTR